MSSRRARALLPNPDPRSSCRAAARLGAQPPDRRAAASSRCRAYYSLAGRATVAAARTLNPSRFHMGLLAANQVAPAVWAIIMAMSFFAALQCFVRYKKLRKPHYRKAAIGCALIGLGIATYLLTEIVLFAVLVGIAGFALVVTSGVIRGPTPRPRD